MSGNEAELSVGALITAGVVLFLSFLTGGWAAGRMARMGWMGGSRPATATDPRALDPTTRSVVVVAAPYAGEDRAAWDPATDRAVASASGSCRVNPPARDGGYAESVWR